MSYQNPYNQPRNSRGNQKSGQRNQQKIIQDQNFSNQIFFGLLSTIESIVLYYQGRTNNYHQKVFTHYDRVDYSSKNIKQLRSQLQSHIIIFQASRKIFLQENPNIPWQLPKKFDRQQAERFLQDAKVAFQNYQDEASYYLTDDVGKLLRDQLDGLFAEKVNLRAFYSQEERKSHRNNLVKNGMLAGMEADKRKAEVENCTSQEELPVYVNQQNYPHNNKLYESGSNVNQRQGQQQHQNQHQSFENGSNMHQSPYQQPQNTQKYESGNRSNGKNLLNMEEQGSSAPYQYWSYYAFSNKANADKVINWSMDYSNISNCKHVFIQTQEELLRRKVELAANKLIHVVPVRMDAQWNVVQVQGSIINLSHFR